MDVQVVSSQGQNSGIKTDGAFLPRILLSGFLLVSVIGNSAFLGLQTSVRRGTSPVYSAPRAAALRCRHNRCASHKSRAGDPSGSSKPRSEGEPVPFTLHQELPHRGASETAAPATRVMLATRGVPPLGIFCSVSSQNLSESVASSHSLRFHWELQSQDVSDRPSWIIPRYFLYKPYIIKLKF